ncbi:hypothetical protein D3C77_683060 [compost metagenome]
MHPVFTTTEGQAPVVQGDLVLNIKAGLIGFLRIVVHGEVVDVREIQAIGWLDHVAWWHAVAQAVVPLVVGV